MSEGALPFDGAIAGGIRVAKTRARYRVSKRAGDLVIASLLLLVTLPLMAIVALAIKLDRDGPAIFRQRRIGGRCVRTPDGPTWQIRPFVLYKFRTMRVDADPSLHREYMAAYLAGDDDRLGRMRPGRRDGESFRPDDPRVTRVGRILRKISLDELPQLWNVIKGDMSLRPPLPYEVEMYREHQFQRLACPPGLTGLAQVKGRSGIRADDLVRLDIEYIHTCSFWLDLKILLLTLPAVLTGKGAD
jgi:lipopolysaccharide/colanic/teichoic acid biosynthesis glycosyltransferase